jgi:hypothetical protein
MAEPKAAIDFDALTARVEAKKAPYQRAEAVVIQRERDFFERQKQIPYAAITGGCSAGTDEALRSIAAARAAAVGSIFKAHRGALMAERARLVEEVSAAFVAAITRMERLSDFEQRFSALAVACESPRGDLLPVQDLERVHWQAWRDRCGRILNPPPPEPAYVPAAVSNPPPTFNVTDLLM